MRKREVLSKIGVSSSTLYRLEKAGNFPERRKLSSNSIGWLNTEVDYWINSREKLVRAS